MSAEQIVNSSAYYGETAYDKLKVTKEDRFGVSQCTDCGFVFTTSVPENDFLNTLYASQDIEKSVPVFARPSRAAYAFQSLSTLLSAMSERMSETPPEPSPEPFPDRRTPNPQGLVNKTLNILDIGCAFGVGSLGLARTHYPYKISGVEWSAATRNYLSSEGMTTYQSVEDIPNTESFDGILLNDVLEHVPNPIEFLEKIRDISHANTAIWVNVPNFIDWRLESIVQQCSAGSMDVAKDFNPWEHLSYFNPESLDQAMATIGATRQINDTIDYPVRCHSISDYIKSLLKFARDLRKIYKKDYLNTVSTAAIYTFK